MAHGELLEQEVGKSRRLARLATAGGGRRAQTKGIANHPARRGPLFFDALPLDATHLRC